MATPGVHNLTVYRGDDFEVTFDFDVNLTGYTLTAQMRPTRQHTLKVAFTVSVTDAANGIVKLTLTPTQTAALNLAGYVWDLQWVDAAGKTRTVLAGTVGVSGDVTR